MPFIKEVRNKTVNLFQQLVAHRWECTYLLCSPCCPLLTHSPFTLFQSKINTNISERTSTVLFSCLHNPPSFQALLSRGITELLLTSDNKEGLKLGGVKGGIVRQADRQTRLHTHPPKQTHAHCLQYGGSCVVFSHNDKRSEPEAAQCQAAAVQNQILHTKESVLYQKVVVSACTLPQVCDGGK